jgi:hypothetical protein
MSARMTSASFPVPTPDWTLMVGEPRTLDSKLLQVGEDDELVSTLVHILYLKEVVGQGPRPRWRGGAIVAPCHRGRVVQGKCQVNT